MSTSDRHPCPVPLCGESVPNHQLMCRPHWHSIAAPLKREVNKTWRARRNRPGDRTALRAHAAACAAATDAACALEIA